MGYMGLKRWGESDMASGTYGNAVEPMLKVLSKSIKDKENAYNTSGPENVAMIIESGLLDTVPDYYIEDYFNYKLLVKELQKRIDMAGPGNKEDWGDEKNRKFHYQSFKRMMKNVKKFLSKKGLDIEDES